MTKSKILSDAAAHQILRDCLGEVLMAQIYATREQIEAELTKRGYDVSDPLALQAKVFASRTAAWNASPRKLP
jgi:predicted kinase